MKNLPDRAYKKVGWLTCLEIDSFLSQRALRGHAWRAASGRVRPHDPSWIALKVLLS
jgi:hypothetical protein